MLKIIKNFISSLKRFCYVKKDDFSSRANLTFYPLGSTIVGKTTNHFFLQSGQHNFEIIRGKNLITNSILFSTNYNSSFFLGSIVYKSYTRVTKEIKYNFVLKRGMRKAAQNSILTPLQKEGISAYLYGFINKTNKKEELLPHLVDYFKDNSLGEFVLKQTIAKGFFPKFTFYKKEALDKINVSSKVTASNLNEKADLRFLPEVIIGNSFAISQENVQKLNFNSEKPSEVVAKTTYGGGNYVKDLTLTVIPNSSYELDIKIGNNGYQNTNHILGPLPILTDGRSYSVLCNGIQDLASINQKRIAFLKTNKIISKDTIQLLDFLNDLQIDKIRKNILIQDELLKIISSGLVKQIPSFYTGYHVIQKEGGLIFYKKLEPFINSNNFNSKKDFEVFAKYGLKDFYESVLEAERSKIFNKSLFKETGFDQIDVENLF